MMPSAHKIFKHTLKIVQQLLHNFQRVLDHFLDIIGIIGLTEITEKDLSNDKICSYSTFKDIFYGY